MVQLNIDHRRVTLPSNQQGLATGAFAGGLLPRSRPEGGPEKLSDTVIKISPLNMPGLIALPMRSTVMVRLLPSGALIIAPSAMVRLDKFIVLSTIQVEPALTVLPVAAKASITLSTEAKGNTSIAARHFRRVGKAWYVIQRPPLYP
jgi:hypothetical protein